MSPSETLVVPVDFSSHSRAAAIRACDLATRSKSGVHLVHSLRAPFTPMAHGPAVPAEVWQDLREAAKLALEGLATDLSEAGVSITTELFEQDITSELFEQDPVAAIRAAADRDGVRLVVMGAHGYSRLQRIFLGSVAERTIRTLHIPVMVVKEAEEDARTPIEKILLATDFSGDAEEATQVAVKWALELGAEVEVLHALSDPVTVHSAHQLYLSEDLRRQIQERVARRLDTVLGDLQSAGLRAASRIAHGPASEEISKRARELPADLIVMGTRGTTGLKHILLGSVAERVLRQASCSVLVASGSA